MADLHENQVLFSGTQDPDLCAGCSIRHSGLCSALSSEEIEDLNAIAIRKRLSVGKSHVFQGDAVNGFANVTSGVAKLVRGAEDGRSQIVGLLFPSDFIGATFSKGSSVEPYAVEAVSELQLCVFPRPKFETLLGEYPALESKLLNRTLNELQLARDWMVLLGRKTAEERVASFLLHIAEKMKNVGCKDQTSFDLPLGRADIADYVGLTLETVSRHLSKLKREKVIQIEDFKRVTFVDVEALKVRSGF